MNSCNSFSWIELSCENLDKLIDIFIKKANESKKGVKSRRLEKQARNLTWTKVLVTIQKEN